MVGRKYQWLIMGTYSETWWKDANTSCGVKNLTLALEGCILTDLLPLSTSGVTTVAGIVSKISFTPSFLCISPVILNFGKKFHTFPFMKSRLDEGGTKTNL